jgi:zinc transport system substrate-binding protein
VAAGPPKTANKRLVIASGAMATIVVLAGLFFVFAPRASSAPSETTVLTTFYPIYDMTRNVGGDRVNVALLIPEGLDVHAFEPTPSAIATVAKAKVLIYNGAGLEPWIDDIIAASGNPGIVRVDSSYGVTLADVPPAFQREGRTADPHIWLSPVIAKKQVANILEGLKAADPGNAAYFTANAANYTAKLDVLDGEARNVSADPATQFFVTFHEAFRYFAQEYNLTQIAVAGPFEESPTASEIQGVVDQIHAHTLCYVGYESLENPDIPNSIASQTNATLILMDPIEGLSDADHALGKTYLIKMQEDLDTFALALNHVGCK